VLVSEWSGDELEKAGYLKEDILVIDQLDKYADIIDTVKEESNIDLNIYDVPLNDTKVLRYFQKGYTADIFQFGTALFTDYLKQLIPDSIEELIDAVALLRPGAMEVNSHNEYTLRKFGDRDITYKFGTDKITQGTKGLIITQEQVMQLCSSLGGFTLAEADDVRKAISKKQSDLMQQQKVKFLEGAIKNGCPKEEAIDIWHDIEVHGSYSFNLSHSVSYTNVSNVGMYFKVYHPLAFWKASFSHDTKNEHTAKYISEINKIGTIQIMPPDINISENATLTDFKTNTVYWALGNVKGLGDVANEQIMSDKEKNGEIFSLEEFIDRHTLKGSKVNKTHYENLIMSGAFDKIENIEIKKDRLSLIEQFRKIKSVKIKDVDNDIIRDNKEKLTYNWWWNLQQKRLSGLAFFDYNTLYNNYFENQLKYPYVDYVLFNEEKSSKDKLKACIAGYVVEVDVRNSAKGNFARIVLENNYDFYTVTVWAEQYEHFEDILLEAKDNLMLINGNVAYDNYRKANTLQTNDDSTIIILS
jgi:DNA polymerase-3 subunit alpha